MSRNDNMAFRHAQADTGSALNRIRDLEAENARLQERVEEGRESLLVAARLAISAQRERDDSKALAERFATSLHYKDVHELPFKDCPYRICRAARAAIDATPEEARKKEKI